MAQTADVVIIGGGVIGCSIAYHLALAGVRNVTVVAKTDAAYLSEVAPVFPVSLGLAVREMLADARAKGTKK